MSAEYQRNRRRHIRVVPEVDHPVLIDINGDNFIDVLHATDISKGGIGISVPHEFVGCKIDMPVSMIITLPFPVKRSVTIEGKINHITGAKFGVEYVSNDKAKLAPIRKYLGYQLRRESIITRLKFHLGLN